MKDYCIVDFDSTFIQIESLDELAKISLENDKNKEDKIQTIQYYTNLVSEDKMSFTIALKKRIELLRANKNHLLILRNLLIDKVSEPFIKHREFFIKTVNTIILSGGFKELIIPVIRNYGINIENVYGNEFVFDANNNIIGFDETNLLSKDRGKVDLLRELNLTNNIFAIGDSYADYEIIKYGLAKKFYAFTGNVERKNLWAGFDCCINNLDKVIDNYDSKEQIHNSLRSKVVLTEKVHTKVDDIFRSEGYDISRLVNIDDLGKNSIELYDIKALGIRSKTCVSRELLEKMNNLLCIGAFCIGTNQVDLSACLDYGIPVFNSPFSNTRSVVELAIAEIIILMRGLIDKFLGIRKNLWYKFSEKSFEVRGKKLGIIGYGNIGSQLSILAESLGMEVYYYDIVEKLAIGNAKKCDSIPELLQKVNIVSVHVDGNDQLIGLEEIYKMQKGSILLNLSRGCVVNIEALLKGLKDNHISGAAIDVFPQEPINWRDESIRELKFMPNVILTPHIGGSTEEAQLDIANFVPKQIIEYLNTGSTSYSVNFPKIQLQRLENSHRLLHIHKNKYGIIAEINKILANNKTNIVGQYLKTNDHIGYSITDIDKKI